MDQKNTAEQFRNHDNNDIKYRNKNNNIIAWLALFIALFGGVPGAVDLINNIWSTKVDIVFEDEPIAGTILSPHHTRHGKLGVFFYKVSFVGKGEKPTTIKRVDFYLKFGNDWEKGDNFAVATNESQHSNNCLFVATRQDQIIVHEWVNFLQHTEDELSYGEKHTFSFGFYFNKKLPPVENCNEWKIVVYDYFGNRYEFNKDTPLDSFIKGNKMYIIDCFVDSIDVVKKLMQKERIEINDLQALDKRDMTPP